MVQGMEALIGLGQEIDSMMFESLENLIKVPGDADGNIEDVNMGQAPEGMDAESINAINTLAQTEGKGYYTMIDGVATRLGTSESVIRQGVQGIMIENLTSMGSKGPEINKQVLTAFNRALRG